MRRGQRTSRRYRGSRSGGMGFLIPLLLVLCAVAAGTLYFINDNMTFTKDGAFFSPKKNDDVHEEVNANLIIETDAPTDEGPEIAPPSVQEVGNPSQDDKHTRSHFVSIGNVKSPELFDAALAEMPENINTVVLEVKAEDGTLAFSSDSAIAKNAAVAGDDTCIVSAIEKSRSKGCKVALYMSCFKDNEAARKNQEYSARTANKIIWLDGNNVRWLSAYSESAREYLISATEKLASFSPDEIILSNISFPAVGKTEILSYDSSLGSKRDMLKSFMEGVVTAAGEIPVSAVYENYNSARIGESGQNAEDFAVFDKIYINSTADRYTLGFEDAKTLFKDTGCTLIPIAQHSEETEFMIKK